jgi:hydrogenase/urease accessory protein HupE
MLLLKSVKQRFFVFLSLLLSFNCYSHQLYESYLFFDLKNPDSPQIRWEVESNNLESIFDLDSNKNEIISWKELKKFKPQILNYLKPHFQLWMDGQKIDLHFDSFELERKDDQTFLILSQTLNPRDSVQSIRINYDLFFDMDPQQICMIRIQQKDKQAPIVDTLKKNKRNINIELENFSISTSMFNFFIEGIWHIWMGWDHLLFLLMLIVASLYQYLVTRTRAQVGKEIIKIVTSFSIAHSVTLILSSLEIVTLPVKWVEICIAISVLITAVANLRPKQAPILWQIAFIFGLIHGFGFANALQEMELEGEYLFYLLFSFNIGVETGQLVLVLIVLPLLMYLKRKRSLFDIAMKFISLITAIVAVKWMIERIA